MTSATASPFDALQLQQSFKDGLFALRRAHTLGLHDMPNQSLFAELALTQHPTFDQHPDIQQLLRQREPDEPLGGLLYDLKPDDWQRIVREQHTTPSQR